MKVSGSNLLFSSLPYSPSGRAQDALVSQIDHAACLTQHANYLFTLYCKYGFPTSRLLLPRCCLLCSHSTTNSQKPRALYIAVSSSNGIVSSTTSMQLAYGVKQRHDIFDLLGKVEFRGTANNTYQASSM